jgi:hypothetical protein
MNIENTKNRDPLTHLVGMIGGGTEDYITGMEKDGQRQVVNSDKIPTEAPWEELEALGFVRGDAVSGDPLFTHVTLPEGWTRAGTGHSMHSDILDERGVPRVGVFYKAAFYDRRADAHIKNVAGSMVTDVVWGEEPVVRPPLWDVLTDAERAGFFRGLVFQISDARETIRDYPQLDSDGRYTTRIARAEEALRWKA